MARRIEFELPVDTSTFAALQLQPRAAAGLTWSAVARWLRVHLVSFPRLITAEKTGLVVMGFTFELGEGEPVSFFDCESVRVAATLRVVARAARLVLDARFTTPGDRTIATTRLLLCPVEIVDPTSLAATPAPLPGRLLERFHPDERDAPSPPRVVPDRRAACESQGELLAERTHPFIVHRHRCEVAEQWSWTEIPSLLEEARERLAMPEGRTVPSLRRCLSRPLGRLDLELGKPFFAFDRGQVATRAYASRGRTHLVHRITSHDGDALHATAVEVF